MATLNELNIFIGTGLGMEAAERAIFHSIVENTTGPYTLHWMKAHGDVEMWNDWIGSPRPEQVGAEGMWVTPFSLFRYAVPALMKFRGTAIYLDVDMVVLADLRDLAGYAREGRWCMADNRDGDCVAVIDCSCVLGDHRWPTIQDLKSGRMPKQALRNIASKYFDPCIPAEWNVCDQAPEHARLIHFTSMATQPWQPYVGRIEYQPHPDEKAVRIFRDYANRPILS